MREELRLLDQRKLWCLTAAGRREAARLLPAGAKLSALRPERDGPSTTFFEHVLDVVATAGLLAHAGFGHLQAFSTEVEHAIPHRRSLFTGLVLRDPGADLPVLLVGVDRDNEGVGTLVEKLTSYRTRSDLRLWPTVYPATGHEGYPPVALVLTPGRKRQRPGDKPLSEEEKAAKAERDHTRLMAGLDEVESGSAAYWSARRLPEWRGGNYHQALPVVAATLQLLEAHGADRRVWRRFGREGLHTLTAALDNPDGDRLLAVERERARIARRAREAAEGEAGRPACRRCGAKFDDDRWQLVRQYPASDDRLCDDCRQADADQRAREAAERERAEAEATAPPRRSAPALGGVAPDLASLPGAGRCAGEFGHPRRPTLVSFTGRW
ncbi:hypothetical protein ACIGXM_31760 [Kitasatospora sp. NPDC052896]|uniref:hypothetical protein n=1 Tax=Kitasatospora sp. NPDC052896 TaxID=3364061 RepID=UPI0037CC184E